MCRDHEPQANAYLPGLGPRRIRRAVARERPIRTTVHAQRRPAAPPWPRPDLAADRDRAPPPPISGPAPIAACRSEASGTTIAWPHETTRVPADSPTQGTTARPSRRNARRGRDPTRPASSGALRPPVQALIVGVIVHASFAGRFPVTEPAGPAHSGRAADASPAKRNYSTTTPRRSRSVPWSPRMRARTVGAAGTFKPSCVASDSMTVEVVMLVRALTGRNGGRSHRWATVEREHIHRGGDADVDQHTAPDRPRANRKGSEDEAGADRAERFAHRLAVVNHAVGHHMQIQ